MNLSEGLVEELKRNRELLEEQKKIPTGAFGAAMIELKIAAGEKAQGSGDAIEMLRAHADLEESK